MSPDLLRGVSVFVEVARLKSVSLAAAALELPKSTVSRRLAALEREIGLRLLTRTPRRIELTEEGHEYFLRCQKVLEEVESAHEALSGKRVEASGHLRVAMSSDFAIRLVSALPEFCRQHPKISLEFDLTTRRVDPASENCDVAVYVGPLVDSGLTAHRLGQTRLRPYASPAYMAGRRVPQSPAELSDHFCILAQPHGPEPRATWVLRRGDQRAEVRVSAPLILNSIGLIGRLAVAGAGVAMLPEDLCRDEVSSGRLVQVLDDWSSEPVEIHALTSTRLLPAKTRAFIEFLRAQVRRASV